MLIMLFLHHLADVAFQPSWLIANKKLHPFAIYEHSFVWAGTVSLGLMYFGIFTFPKFLFLLIGHFIIDYVKYNHTHNYNWIYLDQALHYLQVMGVALC